MKKLFLTSGGFAFSQTLSDQFIELVGKKPQDIKILLVSTFPFIEMEDDAIFYYDPKNVFFRERDNLLKKGFLSENLVNYRLGDEWTRNIRDFDVIYVNGGGGKYEGICKNNFRSHMDELVNSGGVYAAISGGSFLALSFSPDVLGYIECEFDVHCTPGYPAGPVDRTKNDVIGLADGQALLVAGDSWTVIE